MVEFHLNGAPHQCSEGSTIATLLQSLELAEKRVAVERNSAIVPKSAHAQTYIAPNDQIEIVQAIGGG